MSKKKKTVTAPRSFDPGKGRPKEYLAYLNWQEMQALKQLNGEGPYSGPKGIPSFVLGGFGAAGSGTYSSSGQQQKSATTGARGPTGPRGEARTSPAGTSGGGAGSVSRTSGSQEGSRQGGGGSGVGGGTVSGGTRGAGVGKTVDSSGRTTGPSSSLNAPARTQPSADTSARQVAATNDASKALQSTSALKGDFRSGGISQINVGPMGTPVSVGGQVKGAVQRIQEQAYRPAVSPTDRLARTGPIGAPAYTPTMPDRKYQDRAPVMRYAEQNYPQQKTMAQLEREIRDIDRGILAPDEPRYSTEQTLRAYQAEQARKNALAGPNRGIGRTPAAPQDSVGDIYSGANSPFADPGVQSYDPNTYNRVMGIPDSGVRRTTAPYSAPPTPTTPEQERAAMNALRDKYALYSVAATPKLGLTRGLPSESLSMNLPGREGAYLDDAGNYPVVGTSRYAEADVGVPTIANTTGLAGVDYGVLREPVSAPFGGIKQISDRLPQDADLSGSAFSPGYRTTTIFKSPDQEAQEKVLEVENFPEQDMIDVTQEAYERERNYDVRPPVFSGDFSGSPVQGGLTEEQRKKAEADLKRAGNVVRVTTTGTGLATNTPVGTVANRAYKYYSEAKLKELENYAAMTRDEKFAAEEANPALVGWADRLGIESAHDKSHYTKWAAESGLTGSGARERGGNDGTNVGIASIPVNRPAVTPSPGGDSGTSTPSGSRPYIHYQWDLGLNIPSLGDPNYNDYQKYLEQRAAARAALG